MLRRTSPDAPERFSGTFGEILFIADISAQVQYNSVSIHCYDDEWRYRFKRYGWYHLLRYGGIIWSDTPGIIWSDMRGLSSVSFGVIQPVSFRVRTSVSFERQHRYHLADIINYCLSLKTAQRRNLSANILNFHDFEVKKKKNLRNESDFCSSEPIICMFFCKFAATLL